MATSREVRDGQAVYNRLVLSLYDVLVLGVSARLIWRCGKEHMLAAYDRNVGARHLEAGVGTAWFLDRCTFPVPRPEITLLDLNPTVLDVGAARIARYAPRAVRADVLQPLPAEAADRRYDSIGMNFLLHCLPGDLPAKGVALSHAAAALRPGGRLFGSTILSGGVPTTAAARRLMAVYNARGIFHNTGDDLAGLRDQLTARFAHHHITVRGCVALFEAGTEPG